MSIAVVKYGLFDPVKNAKNYIIDSLKEALIVTDPEYQFLFLNPMAETLVSSTKKLSSINNDPEIYELRSGNNNAESYWKSPSETDLRQLGTAQKTVGIKIMVDHALKNNIPYCFLHCLPLKIHLSGTLCRQNAFPLNYSSLGYETRHF